MWTRWGGVAPPNESGTAAAALSEGSMARGTEGMPVQDWKWVLADGVSGEIGIIDQMARYTNDRKGATQ